MFVRIYIQYRMSISTWKETIAVWAEKLVAYSKEVAGHGPSRWKAAVTYVTDLAAGLRSAGKLDVDNLLEWITAANKLEADYYATVSAAEIILDPAVRTASMIGLSHTYSENVSIFERAATAAAAAAAAAKQQTHEEAIAVGLKFAEGLTLGEVQQLFAEESHKSIVTDLFIGTITKYQEKDPEYVNWILDQAKDRALGIEPDSITKALNDATYLSKYHLLQAMSYEMPVTVLAPAPAGAPAGAPTPTEPAGTLAPTVSRPLDLSLPRTRLNVAYNLPLLIDRRAASTYGPVASTVSGLNYKLIERMRTIRATPAREGVSRPATDRSKILTEPESTMSVLMAPGTSSVVWGGAGTWAPFAGPHPRVAAYNDTISEMILDRVGMDQDDGWGPEMAERYQEVVKSEDPGTMSEESVISILAAEFEIAYDKDPPARSSEMFDLVVGAGGAAGAGGANSAGGAAGSTYSMMAASRLVSAVNEARVAHLFTKKSRVPYAAIERESWASAALATRDLATKIQRQLKKVYRVDPVSFGITSAVARRAAFLQEFRRMAAAAVAAMSNGSGVPCLPPSIKIFAPVMVVA